jgi:ubiquinone/menaquinone biosynthesis C-methylase UbiE
MEYLPTQQPSQQGADKYHGAIAQGYDKKREESPKWKIEQQVIEKYLDDLPSGDWVVDCPCGTGRFIPYAQRRGLIYLGVDKSEDMLRQAHLKVTDQMRARFAVADVRALPLNDKQVDAALMIRLTRWLSPPDCVLALRELQRVARKKIISTWRVANHPHARSYDLIKSALTDGWVIARDSQGVDPDYRIIEITPSP